MKIYVAYIPQTDELIELRENEFYCFKDEFGRYALTYRFYEVDNFMPAYIIGEL